MGKLRYEGYSKEDASKDLAEQAAARGGRTFKLQPGKNVLRVIPGKPRQKWKRVVYKHFVDISGGVAIFVCPKHETKGKRKCKTCERARKLAESGDSTDERTAKRLQAQRRVLFNVIDRNDEDSGPKTIDVTQSIERDMTQLVDVDEIDIVDPIKGHDIVIMKTGEGRKNTRYKTRGGKQRKMHTSTEVMQDWIENQPDLYKRDRLEPDEVIEAILAGDDPREARRMAEKKGKRRDDEDDDDDGEEGLDVGKHGRSSKARDEEDEDDEDDDEPKKKGKKKSKRDEDDEDEDEEDDELTF